MKSNFIAPSFEKVHKPKLENVLSGFEMLFEMLFFVIFNKFQQKNLQVIV